MDQREVKRITITTMVSKPLIDGALAEGDDHAAGAVLDMLTRAIRQHVGEAFAGRPYEVRGVRLAIGPPPLAYVIPNPGDGRTWAVEVEVSATAADEVSRKDGA